MAYVYGMCLSQRCLFAVFPARFSTWNQNGSVTHRALADLPTPRQRQARAAPRLVGGVDLKGSLVQPGRGRQAVLSVHAIAWYSATAGPRGVCQIQRSGWPL